jgi:hypothetical protein
MLTHSLLWCSLFFSAAPVWVFLLPLEAVLEPSECTHNGLGLEQPRRPLPRDGCMSLPPCRRNTCVSPVRPCVVFFCGNVGISIRCSCLPFLVSQGCYQLFGKVSVNHAHSVGPSSSCTTAMQTSHASRYLVCGLHYTHTHTHMYLDSYNSRVITWPRLMGQAVMDGRTDFPSPLD